MSVFSKAWYFKGKCQMHSTGFNGVNSMWWETRIQCPTDGRLHTLKCINSYTNGLTSNTPACFVGSIQKKQTATELRHLHNQSLEIGIIVQASGKLCWRTQKLCHNLFGGFKQLLGSWQQSHKQENALLKSPSNNIWHFHHARALYVLK